MPSRANCQLRRRRTLSRQHRRHCRGRVSSGRALRQGTKCEHIVGLAHHCDHPSAPKAQGGLLARAQQTPTRAVPTGRSAQRCESTIRFSGRSVQRCESTMRFTSQNVRSLTDHTTDGSNAKQDELFAHMHTHKINIALLAETWRLGSEDLQAGLQGKFLMLHHGLAAKTCNRG